MTSAASGSSSCDSAHSVGVQQAVAEVATMTGSSTRSRQPCSGCAAATALDQRRVASMPVLTRAGGEILGDGVDLRRDDVRRGPGAPRGRRACSAP